MSFEIQKSLFIAIFIGLFSTVLSASADDGGYRDNALFNLRGAIFAISKCHDLRVHTENISQLIDLLDALGVDMKPDGALKDKIKKDEDELKDMYARGDAAFCIAAYKHWGPDGLKLLRSQK